MAVTQNTYTGDGTTVLFSFTFPYLETTDIKVSLNGTVTTAYTLANATTIQFNTAPATGAAIRIYRDTDDASLAATFYPGSAIRSQDLNENFTQNLYVTQEVNNNSVNIDGSNPMVGPLNMNGFQIDNLATPTSDTDAVNRAYVNDIVANGIGDGDKGDIVVSGSGTTFTVDSGAITNSKVNASAGIVSSKLAFTQAGTGAVQRTVESKLQDVVSVKDFGAVGDGVTDDTAAIQAAIDSTPNTPSSYCPGKPSGGGGRLTILFPEGTYKVTAPLDMSQRDYTRLIALGKSQILSQSTTYVIDMSSCDHCLIDGLSIVSNTARVGIYINRCTSNAFTMFNVIRNTAISLGTDITANSGNGRIGIYNCRGEQNVFENLVLRCDVPYWAQNTDDALFPPTSGTLDTSIVSCTVNTHVSCNFIANGSHSAAVTLKQVSSFEFINCYWSRDVQTLGALNYGIYAQDINHCTFTGSVEVLARFMYVVGTCYGLTANIIYQVSALDSGGVFNLDSSGANGVIDSNISVLVAGGTPAAGACIFKDSGAASSVTIVGNIISTTSLMTPISVVGGRIVNKNLIKTDGQLSLSSPSISGAGIGTSAITGSTIDSTTIGATTASTGAFTTVSASTSSTVGGAFASVTSSTSGVTDSLTTYRGTPDGSGFEHAKVYGGRDTADGFTYGSYLAFYTEGKASGATDTSTEKGRFTASGHFHPANDNTQSLGKAANRWSVVYAGTGTINTSDGREKQDFSDLDAAERSVASSLKGLIKKFRFKDAVELKGDDARIHIGVIAQDVIAAFEVEGLDPFRYGIVCYDQWDAELDENDVQIKPAGNKYGIRYEELLAFIISAL